MALLSIEDLWVSYGKVEAVRGVSLAIQPGQIVTVIGPNGAGKTTLLSAAMGLLRSRGHMVFDGVDLRRLDVEARVERGFSLVPETRELFANMSVADNLMLGGYSRRRDGEPPGFQSVRAALAVDAHVFDRFVHVILLLMRASW